MSPRLSSVLRRATTGLLAGLLGAALVGCGSWKRFLYEGIGRDGWQKPDEVVAALGLQPGSRVADIGAGGGYFTFRLAEAVGAQGRVYAIDVDEALLAYVSDEAADRGLSWVETVRAPEAHPGIPDQSVDLVFLSNVFHHLPEPAQYFSDARQVLRPGGRVAIVEYSENSFPSGHWAPPEDIAADMEAAGYQRVEDHDFLERQSFQVFAPSPR